MAHAESRAVPAGRRELQFQHGFDATTRVLARQFERRAELTLLDRAVRAHLMGSSLQNLSSPGLDVLGGACCVGLVEEVLRWPSGELDEMAGALCATCIDARAVVVFFNFASGTTFRPVSASLPSSGVHGAAVRQHQPRRRPCTRPHHVWSWPLRRMTATMTRLWLRPGLHSK